SSSLAKLFRVGPADVPGRTVLHRHAALAARAGAAAEARGLARREDAALRTVRPEVGDAVEAGRAAAVGAFLPLARELRDRPGVRPLACRRYTLGLDGLRRARAAHDVPDAQVSHAAAGGVLGLVGVLGADGGDLGVGAADLVAAAGGVALG